MYKKLDTLIKKIHQYYDDNIYFSLESEEEKKKQRDMIEPMSILLLNKITKTNSTYLSYQANVKTEILGIKHPIIMEPMFLVTNTKMMIEALNSDIAACIPALNYRTNKELRSAIKEIRDKTNSTALGINLIVNRSNIKLAKQLESCLDLGVDFIITSPL